MPAHKENPEFFGFAPPLLGMEPQRLRILHDDGELIALQKPRHVLVTSDNWYPRTPVLVEAIRHEAARGKAELSRRGIGSEGLWALYDLDPECAGPVLFARSKQVADQLRNEFGSHRFVFGFQGLSRCSPFAGKAECDLPLARHKEEKRMVVSHRIGKQCATTFFAGPFLGSYQFWSGEATLPRRHQLLLHAAESGLPVVGDSRYGGLPALYLSSFKKGYRPKSDHKETPLYPGPAYRLRVLRLPDGGEIFAASDPKWEGMCRQLERHGSPS